MYGEVYLEQKLALRLSTYIDAIFKIPVMSESFKPFMAICLYIAMLTS